MELQASICECVIHHWHCYHYYNLLVQLLAYSIPVYADNMEFVAQFR